MSAKMLEDIKMRINRGHGDDETVKIKSLRAGVIVGNRVTSAGETVPATLWTAVRLINDGLAELVER